MQPAAVLREDVFVALKVRQREDHVVATRARELGQHARLVLRRVGAPVPRLARDPLRREDRVRDVEGADLEARPARVVRNRLPDILEPAIWFCRVAARDEVGVPRRQIPSNRFELEVLRCRGLVDHREQTAVVAGLVGQARRVQAEHCLLGVGRNAVVLPERAKLPAWRLHRLARQRAPSELVRAPHLLVDVHHLRHRASREPDARVDARGEEPGDDHVAEQHALAAAVAASDEDAALVAQRLEDLNLTDVRVRRAYPRLDAANVARPPDRIEAVLGERGLALHAKPRARRSERSVKSPLD